MKNLIVYLISLIPTYILSKFSNLFSISQGKGFSNPIIEANLIIKFANKNKFKLRTVETPGKLDMDLLTIVSDELEDENLKEISLMDEKTKAYFQYLTSYLISSSHMRVVFEK